MFDKTKQNMRNRQGLTKTCLISQKIKEEKSQKQEISGSGKVLSKWKKIASPASADDDSHLEVWEDKDEDMESIVS